MGLDFAGVKFRLFPQVRAMWVQVGSRLRNGNNHRGPDLNSRDFCAGLRQCHCRSTDQLFVARESTHVALHCVWLTWGFAVCSATRWAQGSTTWRVRAFGARRRRPGGGSTFEIMPANQSLASHLSSPEAAPRSHESRDRAARCIQSRQCKSPTRRLASMARCWAMSAP